MSAKTRAGIISEQYFPGHLCTGKIRDTSLRHHEVNEVGEVDFYSCFAGLGRFSMVTTSSLHESAVTFLQHVSVNNIASRASRPVSRVRQPVDLISFVIITGCRLPSFLYV